MTWGGGTKRCEEHASVFFVFGTPSGRDYERCSSASVRSVTASACIPTALCAHLFASGQTVGISSKSCRMNGSLTGFSSMTKTFVS